MADKNGADNKKQEKPINDVSSRKKSTESPQETNPDPNEIKVTLELNPDGQNASTMGAETTEESNDAPKLSEKVVYIDIDEEITALIDRIKKVKADRVYLVLPKRAMLLQSIVNLKILARSAGKMNKELALITSDKKGGSLASQVGLSVYQDLRSTGLQGTQNVEAKPVIPMKAVVDKSKLSKPQIKSNKKSLSDFLRQKTTSGPDTVGFSVKQVTEKLLSKQKSPNGKDIMDTAAFMGGMPNKRLLGLFVSLSVIVLILIAYFVLPKAEVTVEMESQMQTPLERVILADATQNEAELKIYNDNIIASYPIETEIDLTKQYAVSGYESTGTDARGDIVIFNDSAAPQGLIATTRFRSPEGIIYRIQNEVYIPAGGTVTAIIVADKVDEAGQIVGERGNLGPSKFSIPGLTGANKDLIYGKNIEPLYGGTTSAVKIVTEEDINAAREDIVTILKESAKGKLIERLTAENASNNTDYWLLTNDEGLDINLIDIQVLDGVKANDVRDNFEVYAKIKVSGMIFNRQELIQILDRKLRADLHPDMRIAYADKSSLALDYVDYDAREEKVKLNASMSYRLEYELSDSLNANIKNKIVGQDIEEAKKYLQGLPEIGEVHITTWPFWVQSIPGVVSNIEIIKKTAE